LVAVDDNPGVRSVETKCTLGDTRGLVEDPCTDQSCSAEEVMHNRMRRLSMRGGKSVAIFCLAFWLLAARQASGAACKNMSYENRNQTDYGVLQVATVRGVVKDAQGVSIPKACVGIFTEAGHKLVATTQSDDGGQFEFNDIPDGGYRLVAKYEGFSPANAKLRIERRSQTKRSLTVQMRPASFDTTSFIELK
jgi:hypothetical protein